MRDLLHMRAYMWGSPVTVREFEGTVLARVYGSRQHPLSRRTELLEGTRTDT